MSKIVRLEAQNIKRLQAVEISPHGNMVVIGGANGAGKSSVLDSIEYALGGGRSLPAEPIRRGASGARVVVETEDLVVTRTFTNKGGSYLKIEGRDGQSLPSPQAILDRMVGTLTFDPLAFQRQAPKDQVTTLRALLGLDFTKLDAERAELYSQRTSANAHLRHLKLAAESMTRHPAVPSEIIKTTDLMDQFRDGSERNARLAKAEEQIRSMKERLANKKAELEDAQRHVDRLAQDVVTMTTQIRAHLVEISGMAPIDLSVIREDIHAVEAVNEKVRANRAAQEAADAVRQQEVVALALSRKLDEIDEQKRSAISEAKFPIDELAFDGDSVLLNGLPLDQASSAEQLRVSAAMGFSLNPGLRILLIRDGSLLDETSMALMAQMATAADGQIWIERVGDGKEATVLIEDGCVKADAIHAPLPEGEAQ